MGECFPIPPRLSRHCILTRYTDIGHLPLVPTLISSRENSSRCISYNNEFWTHKHLQHLKVDSVSWSLSERIIAVPKMQVAPGIFQRLLFICFYLFLSAFMCFISFHNLSFLVTGIAFIICQNGNGNNESLVPENIWISNLRWCYADFSVIKTEEPIGKRFLILAFK